MRFQVVVNSSEKFPVISLKDTRLNSNVEIYSFGALLNEFRFETRETLFFNCVDGFNSVEDALENITNGFKSTKLSPFVCRLNNGEYSFDGKQYKTNKFYLDRHAIHGLLYDAPFEVISTHADEHHAIVGLRYKYQATDNGYPFAYEIIVHWKLEAENKLSATTTIIHHHHTAIPIADGWHPYFKIGDTINNCALQFDSHTQVEFDETLIPTGKTTTDKRFEDATFLDDTFLDNCFVLKEPGKSKCVLENTQFRLTIHPDSNYPYLQIYTPSHRKSIAIENLSSIPDAFNNGIGLIMLTPNHQHNFTTTYQIKVL